MISEKYKDDLLKLEEIARGQGNKLNLSFIIITVKAKDDEIQEIINHLNERNIEVTNCDIEPDVISDNEDETYDNIKPFNPAKIDIKMDKMTMDSIIKRIKYKEIEFDSDFQRKSGLWKKQQKSQLIESIILKIPLPAFYFDAANDDKWLIIDGLQRITTIKEFVVEKSFKLKGMEFLKELNGLKYDQLPRSLQRRIEEANINAYLVDPDTPLNVKFNIFKRINTGGLVLEAQEIRNALYQGYATQFIKKLATLKEFTTVTDGSIKTDRMLDREFCLRYIAFTCLTLEKYNNSIDEFLNKTMDFLNNCDKEYLRCIKKDFIRSMSACWKIFGRYAFRKMSEDSRRRPINKAIFDIWSCIINSLNDDEINLITKKNIELKNQFIILCSDQVFQNELKSSNKKVIASRITRVQNMVDEILRGDR